MAKRQSTHPRAGVNAKESSDQNRQALPTADDRLSLINPSAAGIDIGSNEHWVCLPAHSSSEPIRKFGAHTAELHAIRDWLLSHNITTVAMESTGIYWVPLFRVLAQAGLSVCLVNARDLKSVRGRPKTDRLDCQWIQRLHMYGLLRPSFRPEEVLCALRNIWRMRDSLIADCSRCVQHMQKALHEMNVLLPKVVADITGVTGMRILRAIVEGERDPQRLAALRHPTIHASEEKIAAALNGTYHADQIFLLTHALKRYDFLHEQMAEMDAEVERRCEAMSRRRQLDPDVQKRHEQASLRYAGKYKNAPNFDALSFAHKMTGVDLSRLPGFHAVTLMGVLLEVGTDLSAWPGEKQFSSWLGLAPNPRRSAGRDLGGRTRKSANRAAQYFRNAASTLRRSKSPLGCFYRRIQARRGPACAVTATAHKLARLFYRLVKSPQEYQETDWQLYEKRTKEQAVQRLIKRAAKLGVQLVAGPASELAS